ncbi:MAG: Spy/CpxP family protein refolding chaperone [Rhizomicrobium sp.]
MKTATTLLFASAIGLFLAQPLAAQPMSSPAPHMGHVGHMGHMGMMHEGGSAFMMLLRSANLTHAQRGQLREILRSEKAQMISVHREFQAVHEQLAARLLAPGAVTAADLEPLEQKALGCQQQIDRQMLDTAIAIRNILTPEQLTRLSQVHRKLESLHAQIQNLIGADQDEGEQQN